MIALICMFLLGFILAICLCALFIISLTDTPTDAEINEMYEYYKREYGENE